jgi:hypothetical protein
MGLFDRLQAKKQKQSDDAYGRYIALLKTLDLNAENKADDAKLEQLMDELGYDIARVRRDHRTVQTALEEKRLDVEQAKRLAVREACEAKLSEMYAMRQSEHARINSVVTKAVVARDEAHGEYERSVEARRHLLRLQADDPQLYQTLFPQA